MDNYEKFVETTDISNHSPLFYILGMLEEAGEVAGVCKRAMRGDYGDLVKLHAEEGEWDLVFKNENVRLAIVKEKGDLKWYDTRFNQETKITENFIKQTNMEKLQKRKDTNTIIGEGDNREDK